LFPRKTDVVPVRLVLGYKRNASKHTPHAVYVYLCKKDHVSKVFMRIGSKPLRVQILDAVKFETPFDHLYDLYGMRDRTMDRFGHLAAYYFLAAGHVDRISTKVDFKDIFADLCSKICRPEGEVVPDIEQLKLTNTAQKMCYNTQSTKLCSANEELLLDRNMGDNTDAGVYTANTTNGTHLAKTNDEAVDKRRLESPVYNVEGMSYSVVYSLLCSDRRRTHTLQIQPPRLGLEAGHW
jgi:hypothetical protein